MVKCLYHILEDTVRMLTDKGLIGDLGEVFSEMGYLIGSNWVTPDVSITHAGQPEADYLEGAPALAIEIISKSNTAEMMQRKVKLYLENGAKEVWAFYPRTESVSVHRGKTSVVVEGTLTSELLPGVSIDRSEVFGAQKGPGR
jgi:Uma2 family endonuclease